MESRLDSLDGTMVWAVNAHRRARFGEVKQETRAALSRSPIVIADEVGGMDWAGRGQSGEGDK